MKRLFYSINNDILLSQPILKNFNKFYNKSINYKKINIYNTGSFAANIENKVIFNKGFVVTQSKNCILTIKKTLINKGDLLFFDSSHENKTNDITKIIATITAVLNLQFNINNINLNFSNEKTCIIKNSNIINFYCKKNYKKKNNLIYINRSNTKNIYTSNYLINFYFNFYITKNTIDIVIENTFLRILKIILKSLINLYEEQKVSLKTINFEVLLKRIEKRIVIIHSGETPLITNENIHFNLYKTIYTAYKKHKLIIPIVYPFLRGLNTTTENTPSILSKIAFQDTVNALTKTTIDNEQEWLDGIKSNILLKASFDTGLNTFNYNKKYYSLENYLLTNNMETNI